MRISLLTNEGNRFIVTDDHVNTLTIFNVFGESVAGELRVGDKTVRVVSGGPTPDLDVNPGFYGGAFTTDEGIEYVAATGIHVRKSGNRTIISSVIDSEMGYAHVLERMDILEQMVRDYRIEIGELRATKFYDGMGVFSADEANNDI